MDIVRSLADTIVDEAGRRAEDAATIEFLQGKVKRLEELLVTTRKACGKEHSQHMRYNVQKEETWKYMRELGKTKEDMDAVKQDVRTRAADNAKAWYDNDEAAEVSRVAQEKEHEEKHRKKCAELRGTAREDVATSFMDQSRTAKLAQDAANRKRKPNGAVAPIAEGNDQSGGEDEEPSRKSAKTNHAHEPKKAGEPVKKAEAAKAKKAEAADAEPHPGTLGIKAPAVSRPKGGKAPAAAAPAKPKATAAAKKPAPSIAKKPAAAKPAATATKPPKGQRKPKTGYQLWMGAPSTKTLYAEERKKAIADLKEGEELPARFKTQLKWYPDTWDKVSDEEKARWESSAEEEKKKWLAAGGPPPAAAKGKSGKGSKVPAAKARKPDDSGSDSDASDGDDDDDDAKRPDAADAAADAADDDDAASEDETNQVGNPAEVDSDAECNEDEAAEEEGDKAEASEDEAPPSPALGAEAAASDDEDDDALSASK